MTESYDLSNSRMAAPAATKQTTVREHLFKVLVIGEFGVGKTSVIRRYVEGYFTPNYKLTIGVDFALKTIKWDDNTTVNLQLWDIAGHERFGHMTRVYYKYAIAAIIVFDLSRPATFDSVTKWLNDVNSKVMLANEDPIPVLLLANKCDVENAHIERQKLKEFCETHNIIGWFDTSARDNVNIDEAMTFLMNHIMTLPCESQQPQEHVTLPEGPHLYEESFETDESPKSGPTCCR